MLTEDDRSEIDVKTRFEMAKDALNKRKELLRRNMSLMVKKKIVKTIVYSVALYGCETYTLKKDESRWQQALKM